MPRRLIMWNLITLDGYFEGDEKWDLQHHNYVWGDELERFSIEQTSSADVILFGPSNPWLSIGPMMAIPDMADLLRSRQIPRVALTPIIDGKAVKGPAAKIMGELGMEVSAQSVMDYYGDLLNGFITDERDQRDWQSQSGEASRPDSENLHSVIYKVQSFDTIMGDTQSKVKLAKKILETLQGWK